MAISEQYAHSRACLANRFRHKGVSSPRHCAAASARPGQRGAAIRARTTIRATSSWPFILATRTVTWCGSISSAATSSARVRWPVVTSHQSDSRWRSSASSQRVARATSRRWPERPSSVSVRSTKSAPGSASCSASSSDSGAVLRDRLCSRTWFIATATSQERKRSGSRKPPRPRTTRSIVSWTTSSTSPRPASARPTMLYTSGRYRATSSSSDSWSPSRASLTSRASICPTIGLPSTQNSSIPLRIGDPTLGPGSQKNPYRWCSGGCEGCPRQLCAIAGLYRA